MLSKSDNALLQRENSSLHYFTPLNYFYCVHWKNTPKIQPANGQTRVKTRFAWLPKRIVDATYWLVQYEETWVYDIAGHATIQYGKDVIFPVGKWVLLFTKPVKWVVAE